MKKKSVKAKAAQAKAKKVMKGRKQGESLKAAWKRLG
jgi:hypothetical protein